MTTQSVVPFQFENLSIRVINVNGQPWFVAKDVLSALEYAPDYNPARAVDHVPEEWRGVHPIHTLGGTQNMLTISEQGLYFFVNRSDKPKALPFQKWVAGEVIPSIQKTGGYSVYNSTQESTLPLSSVTNALQMVPMAVAAAQAFGFKDNLAILSANQCVKTATGISVLEYMGQTHLLANPKGQTFTPTELGKLMNPKLSAVKMNLLLESAGLQAKVLDHWMPSDDASEWCEWLDTGKRHSDGTPVKQLKWFRGVLEQIQRPVLN